MITGRPETRDGVDHLVLTRTFEAGVEDVWAAVTEPDRLARWFGTWSGDPASGQVLVRWLFDGVGEEAYVIETCEPPRHLRVHNVSDDPGQVWVLDLRLREEGGSTVLDLAQVMNDALPVSDVGPGWEWYLDRLEQSVRTGAVSDLVWKDGDEGYGRLGPAYAQAFGQVPGGSSARG